MGRNPEFFVAGRYTRSQVVVFAVVVALVPSIVLAGACALVGRLHARAGGVVLTVLLAALGALLGNVVLRGFGRDGAAMAVLVGAVGATVAVLASKARASGLFLRYLAAANVLFLGAFLFTSPASALLSGEVGADALGSVRVPEPPGPVVVIVFDELPLPTLMRSDGTINAERYPAFARLAASSTWYRNASSPHHRTERAVPALVTGNVLDERTMPTYTALPRNLLALLGTAVPVERYEPVTDLCPRSACEARPGQPLTQALEDSMVVFGHRVLPGALRDDLPAIDDAWGSFGDAVGDTGPPDPFADEDPLGRWHGAERSERSADTQAARLVQHGLAIGAQPALHFIHVVLPHPPWFATPWGPLLMRPMPAWEDEEGHTGDLAAWSSLIRYQRHSLQTGAADVALGEVLDHLSATKAWDRTTLVVAADHGTSTIPPDVKREPTDTNREEVFRVPLFVKAPGQEGGRVVDDVAMTIDVLPTLIDVLGIDTDWEMDGHSLRDGSAATTEPLVSTDVAPLFDLVRRHERDFPHGWDWKALAAVGEHGGLVGTPQEDLAIGDPSPWRVVFSNESAFAQLPDAAGRSPQILTGTVTGPAPGPPPPIVLVVNGTVAGVAGGFAPDGAGWTFSSVLGPYLRTGANVIEAYEVTPSPGRPELHLVP